jgi:predicted permease
MAILLQVSALFILMAIGFLANKIRVIDAQAIKGMSALLVKACLPALILTSLQKPFSSELFGAALQTLLVATLFYLAIIAISIAAARLLRFPPEQRGAVAFALSFSNCGFIGFPVVTSVLGKDALFLTAMHNVPFNVLAFTVGIVIMTGFAGNGFKPDGRTASAKRGIRIPLKSILNMNVIAAVVGFAFFVASITLPPFVAIPLEMLAQITTPLAMVVTGAMLARIPLKSVFGNWKLYVVCALRLAVWPALAALAMKFAGVSEPLASITIIIAGIPAASNTSLIAEVYGGDADTASTLVCLSTMLSVVSIPVLALLLK